MQQQRAAAAAATHLNIYGSNPVIIIPYIVMYVTAPLPQAAASFMEKHRNPPGLYTNVTLTTWLLNPTQLGGWEVG